MISRELYMIACACTYVNTNCSSFKSAIYLNVMGRQKRNNVYKYFNVNKTALKSRCLVCNKDLNSINASNLMRHLKVHKTEYEEVVRANINQQANSQLSSNSETIIRACTNLVTVHGRPLALLDDEAFQDILALIPNCNVKIGSRKIRNCIMETAGTLRIEMAKELQDKLICIKIDIASISLRSFMGINAQYIEQGTIVLKTLAMIELLDRHTSEHLKEQVLFVLQRFRISLDNIYSFTTDNGANMLKMSRLLNERSNVENHGLPYDDPIGNSSTDDVFMEQQSGDHIEEENISVDSNSEFEFDYDADTECETAKEIEFTETVTSSLSMHFHENTTQQRNIAVVRCAAHTLQLSVLEACNNTEIKEAISDARRIAKLLRTQKYAGEIAKAGKNQAILDCPTRWNSTADMIQRLIDLKEICNNANDNNCFLTEATWNKLHDYLSSLFPAKELSKILQGEHLTMGDFYLQWLLCKIKLNTVNTPLSSLLINCMERREQTLFNNDAFLCAIFLDGRVNSTLSEDQRHASKIKLLELHQHLQYLNSDKENCSPSNSTTMSYSCQTNTEYATLELDNFLSLKYVEAQDDIHTLIRRGSDNMERHSYGFKNIDEELAMFIKEPLLKSSENILKHWELNKNKYSRLYRLACIVLASPATQVSVERLFSSLKCIVSKYRFNLKRNIIEDIIFIRNNKSYNSKK